MICYGFGYNQHVDEEDNDYQCNEGGLQRQSCGNLTSIFMLSSFP